MFIVVSAGFLVDLCRLETLNVAAVQARVDACTARWGLFWLLGFVGTLLMMITERPAIFLGFFGVLKAVFESWARLARVLGWRSLRSRRSDGFESTD